MGEKSEFVLLLLLISKGERLSHVDGGCQYLVQLFDRPIVWHATKQVAVATYSTANKTQARSRTHKKAMDTTKLFQLRPNTMEDFANYYGIKHMGDFLAYLGIADT